MVRATILATLAALGAAIPAQSPRWPYDMDFGPSLLTTLDAGGHSGVTHKALVIRLGDDGAVAFDTELLRLSAAWTGGFLQLLGTAYDGSHGPVCRPRGHRLLETGVGPGWAKDGAWQDPRPIPHGPLPRDHGRYRGHHRNGDDVVIAYQVNGMGVWEHFALAQVGGQPTLVRTLRLEPAETERWLLVQDQPDGVEPGTMQWQSPPPARGVASLALQQWQPAAPGVVTADAAVRSWEELAMGGPSDEDYADRAAGTGAVVRWVPGFSVPHGWTPPGIDPPTPEQLTLPRLNDGAAAQNDDDWNRSVWFERRKTESGERDDGRIHVDLQTAVPVSRISTYTWHFGRRSVQDYDLYASAAAEPPALDTANPTEAGWVPLGRARTGELGNGDRHGASFARPGGTLGEFRHLLFAVRSGAMFLSEIDVWAADRQAPVDRKPRRVHNAVVALLGEPGVGELVCDGGRMLLRVPPHRQTVNMALCHAVATDDDALTAFVGGLAEAAPPRDLRPLLQAGPRRWGDPLTTRGERGPDDDAYAVDTIAIPFDNRFGSRMRTAAFDFFSDGRAAITTWNGDVWLVSGIDDDLAELRWQRFATGLFDPLGLKIVDGLVYVHGRDGITRLHDLNGDGEADFYECFNNDVQVTRSFHEFAFDLQTDAAGNFYFSKGGPVNPGGRGFQKIVPHHGTIMRLSPDGERLEVIATGLRAPNGIGVGPDGVITSGDNEGTWMPRCRLNWFTQPGYYAGVRDTAHRSPVPEQPDLPLCWLPMDVDNSGGGQVWVTGDRWGPLAGRLLHLSYGTCSVFLVLPEQVDSQVQGGVVRLPLSFSSSCMRARFHPVDGQLYVAGLQGWQTSAAREGGFHRVRYTGKPLRLPVALHTTTAGVYLTFLEPLDPELAVDPGSYGVEIWNYRYSQNYGSPELSILHPEREVEQGKPNRDPLPVTAAQLSADGRTVFLAIPDIQPVMQMRITWNLESAAGERVRGELHNTIHRLAPDRGIDAVGR